MKKIIATAVLALALPATAFSMGENLEELTPGYGVTPGQLPVSSKSGMKEPEKSSRIFNESNDLNPDWGGPK